MAGGGARLSVVLSHIYSYLDFLVFSRTQYVIDIYISKRQRLSFPRTDFCFALRPRVLKDAYRDAVLPANKLV